MAVDVFKGILKLIVLFIAIEVVLMIDYITSKFYIEDLIGQKAKCIGHKIKSFLGVETEQKERFLKKYSSCVFKHAAPYYILGASIGYLSCRCWKGFKEGMTFGVVRGEALGVYVGAIECDEGKKE